MNDHSIEYMITLALDPYEQSILEDALKLYNAMCTLDLFEERPDAMLCELTPEQQQHSNMHLTEMLQRSECLQARLRAYVKRLPR